MNKQRSRPHGNDGCPAGRREHLFERQGRIRIMMLCSLVACWLAFSAVAPKAAQAQACNVVVAAATTSVDGATVSRVDGTTGVRPGDTVCLMGSSTPKPFLSLRNFVGTVDQPLLITNAGGLVLIGPQSLQAPIAATHTGFSINGSKHFVLSGKGDPAHQYGIYVRGTAAERSGLSLGLRSEHFRVEAIEVSHTGFAGIMSKTDPDCALTSNRGVWVQHATYFQDNYIHDTHGEGFYVGHTSYDGHLKDCDGNKVPETTLYPHVIEGVAITRNRVERTGWDGIQLSSATVDARVYSNVIADFGLASVFGQQHGIQIGSGTTGWVDRNIVRDGTGNGIEMHGDGDNFVANNLILRPDGAGIYIGDWGANPGKGFFFFNNTIIASGKAGIRMLNRSGVGNAAYNNIIAEPGRLPAPGQPPDGYFSVDTGVDWTADDNIPSDNVAALNFVNAAADDYHLQANSPAVNAGRSLPQVQVDLDGVTRPQGSAFDIGAYELAPNPGLLFQQDFQSSTAIDTYVHATNPSASQFNDISAKANGGNWSINQGRLQLVRTGSDSADNGAGITRCTDFAGLPLLLHVAFDLGVSNWSNSPYQTNAMTLSIGKIGTVTDYDYGEVAVDTFQTLSVNGKGPGQYVFATAGVESAVLAANGTLHRVSLFLNKSNAAASYRAPDGTAHTLRASGVALWIDAAPVVSDAPATNGSSSALTDLRVRFTHPDNGTWTLDNIVIRSAFPQ